MSTFTPGPWTQEARANAALGHVVYADDKSDRADHGDVVVIADHLTPENARLIASAPELLEALRCSLLSLRWCKHIAALQDCDPLDSTITLAEAVIAKAEAA